MTAAVRALAARLAVERMPAHRIEAEILAAVGIVESQADARRQDGYMRAALVRDLRRLREAKGLSQREVGETFGITGGAISGMERTVHPKPTLAYVQRFARIVGLRLRLVPVGLVEPDPDGERDMYARLADGSIPDVADEFHRMWLHALLVAARRETLTVHEIADRIGISFGGVKSFEGDLRHDTRLDTLQRYYRGLGARLDYDLQPVRGAS